MSGIYEIEELIRQDDFGVIFQAIGSDQSKVALFRFFLPESTLAHFRENPEAFPKALADLQKLASKTLRPVVAGGIDPVDQTPWVALPWQSGRVLSTILDGDQSIPESDALALWNDGNQTIQHLGECAHQLSFDPQDIILITENEQTTVNFMISLRRWFLTRSGNPQEAQDPKKTLTALYHRLSEKVSHPKPAKFVTPPKKNRIGPAPNSRLGRKPNPHLAAIAGKPAPLASAKGISPIWPLSICAILLAALGVSLWIHKNPRSSDPPSAGKEVASQKPQNSKASEKPSTSPVSLDQPAGPEVVLNHQASSSKKENSPTSSSPQSPSEKQAEPIEVAPAPMEPVSPVLDLPNRHFLPENQAAITALMGEDITLVGVVQGLGESASGKTVYVRFGWSGKVVNAQAILSQSEGLSREVLDPFKNKKIALSGTVRRDHNRQTVVQFNSITDLQIIEP